MRDDYRVKGASQDLKVKIEKDIADQIQAMSKHTQLTVSELVNTALKRFCSSHKDFLPPDQRPKFLKKILG